MIVGNKARTFLSSETGLSAIATLEEMCANNAYKTEPTYSADSDNYPDNMIPFVDKHITYLSTHLSVNPDYYLANLRLMTRLR